MLLSLMALQFQLCGILHGAIIVLSSHVRDLQVELPRLAQSASISLRRVEPLDDSLESVFGYLVER